ncbi:MAG: TetR family transcriptional regulator [Nitrospirota bacterium]|nr:MAG: TetR family transcriptional regulator [Nitrospirota bacterium]
MINKKDPQDTKTKILDSAESLFSQKGFKGTSMREITSRADVNLASVNYHFGSKEALLEEVIKRRILPINEIRERKLLDIESSSAETGISPEPSDVIRAFLEPTIRFMDTGQGAREFISLIGRSISDPDDTVRNIFHKYIITIFELFFKLMQRSLPHLPSDVLFWRIHFVLGSMQHTMRICGTNFEELERFNTDTETLIDYMMDFIMGGISSK